MFKNDDKKSSYVFSTSACQLNEFQIFEKRVTDINDFPKNDDDPNIYRHTKTKIEKIKEQYVEPTHHLNKNKKWISNLTRFLIDCRTFSDPKNSSRPFKEIKKSYRKDANRRK